MPRIRFLLLAGFALGTAACAPAVPWLVTTDTAWHDNVTNAERSVDVLPALQGHAELHGTLFSRALEDGHRLRLTAGGLAEIWPRFEGLNRFATHFTAGWEYKPWLGPYRPVIAAETEGEWTVAQEPMRGGFGGAGRLSVRQRAGAAWLLSAGHEWRLFDARGKAFDRTAHEWVGRVEWSAGADWSLAIEGRERVGDVVSYSRPPRPDIEAIGKPITYVGTFEQDVPWIAYYFRARTRSGAVEVQRSIGRTSLMLRHEYRLTLHAGPGYKNHRTTLRLAIHF